MIQCKKSVQTFSPQASLWCPGFRSRRIRCDPTQPNNIGTREYIAYSNISNFWGLQPENFVFRIFDYKMI